MSIDQWGGQIMPPTRSCLSGYRCTLCACGEAFLWKVKQWEQTAQNLCFKFCSSQTATLRLSSKTLQRDSDSCVEGMFTGMHNQISPQNSHRFFLQTSLSPFCFCPCVTPIQSFDLNYVV